MTGNKIPLSVAAIISRSYILVNDTIFRQNDWYKSLQTTKIYGIVLMVAIVGYADDFDKTFFILSPIFRKEVIFKW